MWKSACVGVYQLLNWKMHGGTLKLKKTHLFQITYELYSDTRLFSVAGEYTADLS